MGLSLITYRDSGDAQEDSMFLLLDTAVPISKTANEHAQVTELPWRDRPSPASSESSQSRSQSSRDPSPRLTSPATPTTHEEWLRVKPIIEDLYLIQNLNLKGVAEIMCADHGFKATPRMYKTQFRRWGWSKYDSKNSRKDLASGRQLQKPKGKSCRRQHGSRQLLPMAKRSSSPAALKVTAANPVVVPPRSEPIITRLHHDNDSSLRIERVLSELRSHIRGVYDQKSDWKQTEPFDVMSAYDHYGAFDLFRVGVDHIRKGKVESGFRVLNGGFREVESTMQSDYSGSFYCLFIELPDLLLRDKHIDILGALFHHIDHFAEIKVLNSSLGRIFSSLYRLAKEDPAQLYRYVVLASRLWTDSLTMLRGMRDRSTMIARRNYLRHARKVDEYSLRQIISEYDELHQHATRRYGESHVLAGHLEDVILMTQHNYDFYLPDFEERCQKVIARCEGKYEDTEVPVRDWDLLDRNFYSNSYERLALFLEKKGDESQAAYCKKKALEGWDSLSWHDEVERRLRKEGKNEEADRIRWCRLESQYYGKITTEFEPPWSSRL